MTRTAKGTIFEPFKTLLTRFGNDIQTPSGAMEAFMDLLKILFR
jgi:hypothetical protein